MRVAGLALLALIAGACVTVEVQPGAGSDTSGVTGTAPQTTVPAADSQPDTSGPDGTHPPATTDSTETAPAPTGSTGPPTTDPPETDPPATDPPATSPTPTDSTEPPTTDTPDTATTTTAPETGPATTAAADVAAPTSDPEAPETTTPLPGEPYEYGPAAGVSLAVVGVDHDDVLNVRDVPFGEIIATLGLANPIAFLLEVRRGPSGEPIAHYDTWTGAIVATGSTRKLSTTVWHEVQVAGLTGWASGAYLAPIGLSDDITAHLIDVLGERPVAGTLIELGLIVGNALASDEPPSRVVVTVGPSVFEALGEVTVDVLNIGDDSLLGFRLLVFATPGGDWMSEDPGPFTLRTVERTVLCYSARGVTAEGLCV